MYAIPVKLLLACFGIFKLKDPSTLTVNGLPVFGVPEYVILNIELLGHDGGSKNPVKKKKEKEEKPVTAIK
jgi:hypothetical protein